MAPRCTIISRSLSPLLHLKRLSNSSPSSAIRFFNDKSRVFEDEERARENLYIKKVEKEKIEKQKEKLVEKEKTDKGQPNEKKP